MEPKCNTPGCTGKLVFMNAIEVYPVILGFWRCEECFQTHQFEFSTPRFVDVYNDPPRLICMTGDSRYTYFVCSKEGDDCNTLVAVRGRYVSREKLEAMGYKVEDGTGTLPAYRLYELK